MSKATSTYYLSRPYTPDLSTVFLAERRNALRRTTLESVFKPRFCQLRVFHKNEEAVDRFGAVRKLDMQELIMEKRGVKKAHEFICDYFGLYKRTDQELIRVLLTKGIFTGSQFEIVKEKQPSITFHACFYGKKQLTERLDSGHFSYFPYLPSTKKIVSVKETIDNWQKFSLFQPSSITREQQSDRVLISFARSESLYRLKYSDYLQKNSREFKKIA